MLNVRLISRVFEKKSGFNFVLGGCSSGMVLFFWQAPSTPIFKIFMMSCKLSSTSVGLASNSRD